MNTEGEKIQWHPAFDAALQIELGEEAKYLTFEPEHLLSKKPMQIDVLVKNEKKVKIRKNIGRIFRQHNIIEYKSPEDHLNIDDFYKVYGYTCIYKTEVEKVNQIPAEELTITFVCYHYPRQMLRNLQNERNINVKNIENGIYYLYGDAIPIQLIIVPELSIENNYWLNKLRNNLKSGGEIKLFMEQYEKDRVRRILIIVALCVIIAMIGISRIYLGVHFASDVLGGFCLSLVWLVFFTRIIAPLLIADKDIESTPNSTQ